MKKLILLIFLSACAFAQTNIHVNNVTADGIVKSGDGSAAAPAYTFINATTRGFFNDTSAGGIGIAHAGVQRALISTSLYSNMPIQMGSTGILGFTAGAYTSATDTGLSRISARILGIGDGTAGNRAGALLIDGGFSQSGPIVSARSNGFITSGNALEWGHSNAAGYGSNIGWETTTGVPFICFMCEAGTTTGTYRTRGNTASIIRGDASGNLTINTLGSANADNQSRVQTALFDTSGNLSLTGSLLKFSTDTGLSRSAAGTVAVGNGSASDTSGTLTASILNARLGGATGAAIVTGSGLGNSYIDGSGGTSGNGGYVDFTNDASTTTGYGAWLTNNAFWNGTNWIQVRGVGTSSSGFTVNHHKGFSFNFAAAGGSNNTPITWTEVANISSSGNLSMGTLLKFSTDTGISRLSAGNIAVGNGTASNASGSAFASHFISGTTSQFTGAAGDMGAARGATEGAFYLGSDGTLALYRPTNSSITMFGATAGITLPGSTSGSVNIAASATGGGVIFTNNAGNAGHYTSSGDFLNAKAGGCLLLSGSGSGTTCLNASSAASGTVTLPAATDTLVGKATSDTLTNKRITSRAVSMSDATSVTPTSDTADINTFVSTQVAGTLTVNAPSGTPTDGQKLILRLKSTNAQTYSFNATYAFSTSVPAPTTLAAGTTDYIGIIWNATNTKWDVVAVDQGH